MKGNGRQGSLLCEIPQCRSTGEGEMRKNEAETARHELPSDASTTGRVFSLLTDKLYHCICATTAAASGRLLQFPCCYSL